MFDISCSIYGSSDILVEIIAQNFAKSEDFFIGLQGFRLLDTVNWWANITIFNWEVSIKLIVLRLNQH